MPVVADLETHLPATLFWPDLTGGDWLELCRQYPDNRLEYSAEGDLIISPGTDTSTAFVLPNGARRSPDAAWMSTAKNRAIESAATRFPVMAPDFVVEVQSPGDRRKQMLEKMAEWIENGVALAWLIDPERRQVLIFRPHQHPELMEQPSKPVEAEAPVDGFALDLGRVWS